MKTSRLFVLACFPMLFIILFAVVYDLIWLRYTAEFITIFILFIGFFRKMNLTNVNFASFLILSILGIGLEVGNGEGTGNYLNMICQMGAYFFLGREALRYTKRETGNKFMRFFFFLMIGANVYFVFEHFQEIINKMGGLQEYWFYLMYYVILMLLAIVALIYYLNSYSRKSVFFIVLVMTIVVSDILRDMAIFYLPDTSVMLLQNFLQFVGLILAFQFFTTREKKLRLINLV